MFTVALSVASGRRVTVAYATADGTASGGADYAATSGTLAFAPGDVSKTVAGQVSGDVVDELDEQYSVQLSNPTNASITDAVGTGRITDDDDEPTLSIDDVVVVEGDAGAVDAVFTVTLSAASGQTVTVAYTTVGRERHRGRGACGTAGDGSLSGSVRPPAMWGLASPIVLPAPGNPPRREADRQWAAAALKRDRCMLVPTLAAVARSDCLRTPSGMRYLPAQ